MLNLTATTSATVRELCVNGFNNVISGGAGSGALNARGVLDHMTGAGDAGTVVLRRGADSTDTITDFAHDLDVLQISTASFGSGLIEGQLDPARFVADPTGQATTSGQRFICETDTGNLFFNSNASGIGGILLIATLLGHPNLDAGDFSLV